MLALRGFTQARAQADFNCARTDIGFGVDYHRQTPAIKVSFGYQYNYLFTDGFDALANGRSINNIGQVTIVIKVAAFGRTFYRKQINY